MPRKEPKLNKSDRPKMLPPMPKTTGRTIIHPEKDEAFHDRDTAMEVLKAKYPDLPPAILMRCWSIWYAAQLDEKKAAILEDAFKTCPKSLNTVDQWKDQVTEFPGSFSVVDNPSIVEESDDGCVTIQSTD